MSEREHVPSNWQQHAARGEWLEAAKLAVLDQGATSDSAMTCAIVALTIELQMLLGSVRNA